MERTRRRGPTRDPQPGEDGSQPFHIKLNFNAGIDVTAGGNYSIAHGAVGCGQEGQSSSSVGGDVSRWLCSCFRNLIVNGAEEQGGTTEGSGQTLDSDAAPFRIRREVSWCRSAEKFVSFYHLCIGFVEEMCAVPEPAAATRAFETVMNETRIIGLTPPAAGRCAGLGFSGGAEPFGRLVGVDRPAALLFSLRLGASDSTNLKSGSRQPIGLFRWVVHRPRIDVGIRHPSQDGLYTLLNSLEPCATYHEAISQRCEVWSPGSA